MTIWTGCEKFKFTQQHFNGETTVKILDDATVLAEFLIPATNQTNAQGTTTYMQFPGTGFRASTALKFQIVTTATSVTLLHG